jgi:pimeloyl-ACP methyl ester carboxylesterase
MRRALALVLAVSALAPLPVAAPKAMPPAAPKTERRAYIEGPWGQIHVRIAGPENGPTILLIHKMVWSSVEFTHVQPLLAERGIRSIAVDLPGYGLSDEPAAQPSADDYADAMIPVLDALHVHRAVVAGTDTGATIAAAFGLRHPDRTADLILEGLPIFKGKMLEDLLAEPEFDRTAKRGAATLIARWGMIDAMGGGSLSPELMQTGILQFFGAGQHYLYGHQAIFRYDLEAALGKLRVPVMLLSYPGDQLHAQAVAAKAAHPAFTLIEIDAPRMMADFQFPQLWARAVADRTSSRDDTVR